MESAKEIINRIIAIGLMENYQEMEFVNSKDLDGSLLWSHNEDFWQKICSKLSTEDITTLLKTLVFADGRFKNWSTYSVTHYCLYMLFILYERLGANNYKGYEDLLDWIFKNRRNPYLPYLGNIPLSVNNLSAYRKYSEARKAERIKYEANKKKEYEEAQMRKKMRKELASKNKTNTMIAQSKRKNNRKIFLSALKTKTQLEVFRIIITDNNHNINYYPEEYSIYNEKTVEQLSSIERQILISKLNNSHGAWKILRNRVRSDMSKLI